MTFVLSNPFTSLLVAQAFGEDLKLEQYEVSSVHSIVELIVDVHKCSAEDHSLPDPELRQAAEQGDLYAYHLPPDKVRTRRAL